MHVAYLHVHWWSLHHARASLHDRWSLHVTMRSSMHVTSLSTLHVTRRSTMYMTMSWSTMNIIMSSLPRPRVLQSNPLLCQGSPIHLSMWQGLHCSLGLLW